MLFLVCPNFQNDRPNTSWDKSTETDKVLCGKKTVPGLRDIYIICVCYAYYLPVLDFDKSLV